MEKLRLFLLALFLISAMTIALADEITCFQDGQKIYHGFTDEVYHADSNTIWFEERNTNHIVFLENLDCIIKYQMKR